MQVILREDVSNLGKSGEVVEVRNGYGRNYLLPKGLAILATRENMKQIEHQKRVIAARNEKLREEAKQLVNKLSSVQLMLTRLGAGDKLFGSVGSRDIQQELEKQGISIERKRILLPEPLRQVGEYLVDVRFVHGIIGQVKVYIQLRTE